MEESNNGHIPWLALLTVVAGSFVAVLVSSSVNVALPKLMAVFGVNTESIQWVVTAYTLVCGVVVPTTGYLAMRFGSKRIFIIAVAFFTIGSSLCAMSWSNNSLIVARVLQGIGGGMINPVGMAIIYYIVPRDRMGMAMGVYGIAIMVAPAIGPTIGGYLVDHFSWEWVFVTNIPIGIMAIFLASVVLEETPRQTNLKPDILGIILCTSACFTLLLALSQGMDKGWDSLYIVNLFIFSGFSLVLFVIWELIFPQPLIDMRLLNNRTFCLSLVAVSLLYIALYAGSFFIPLYAQTAMGYTPMQTGLLLMPASIVTAIMMPISGRLFDKIGAMPVCVAGFAITGYATYQLHNLGLNTSFSEVQWMMIERSFGLGLALMPLTTVGMNTIPKFMVSQGAALNNLIRQIAISIGIPILTVIMTHREIYHTAWLSETVNWSSPPTLNAINKLSGLLYLHGVPESLSFNASLVVLANLISLQSFIDGIDDAFIVAAVVMATAIPIGFFLNKKSADAEIEKQHQQFLNLVNSPDKVNSEAAKIS